MSAHNEVSPCPHVTAVDALLLRVDKLEAERDLIRAAAETIDRAHTAARDDANRLRDMLAEALDGWAFTADTMHRACCLDRHTPEHCRGPRIAEIRREAGL